MCTVSIVDWTHCCSTLVKLWLLSFHLLPVSYIYYCIDTLLLNQHVSCYFVLFELFVLFDFVNTKALSFSTIHSKYCFILILTIKTIKHKRKNKKKKKKSQKKETLVCAICWCLLRVFNQFSMYNMFSPRILRCNIRRKIRMCFDLGVVTHAFYSFFIWNGKFSTLSKYKEKIVLFSSLLSRTFMCPAQYFC